EKREKKLNETARQLVYYNGFLYGNYSFGLNKINPNNLQISKNYYQAGISSIINFQNQLIISTSNGIKVLKNDSIKTVLIQNKNFNKPILKLQKVSKSELVIGTDGFGAYLTDLKTITLLPKSDFLSVQNIFISNNNIWLATEIGVWHYKKINHNYKLIKHYTKADGLPEDKINSIYVKGNSIIIGSDNGVATIPIHNQQVTQFLDIYFENSAYNSKKMDKQHASFLYTKANNVTFSIATINHSVSNKEITYQYKLNPIQKKWINTSFKNLNFNDLPPNKYKLSVNSHGIIKSVNFQILPLWYQTSIAKIIFIVLFLTVTTGIILIIRKKELEKQLKKLNTQKQLSEFELHALRSQMNPHFVFNSLNAIQYYITKNDIELSEKYLVKFSRLIRKFFDFSRNKLINLEQEISLLKNYLEIEKMRFGNTFNFQFNIRENLNLSEEKIPSMLLQPIVENAVNHGLFHNEGNGLIKIDFLKNEDLLIVQISDNGIGLKKAQEIKDNSIKTHVSKSNSILKDRINLLNQSKEWFITYSINELKNATGTIVKLTFMHYEN
ncbi:histidine kinase, partial [Lutibacter sp.]|uniref:sensor histidine kinase n=1 Tax=Lutibacter sp. TaxID=1925666 RepID=UPI0025C5CAC9